MGTRQAVGTPLLLFLEDLERTTMYGNAERSHGETCMIVVSSYVHGFSVERPTKGGGGISTYDPPRLPSVHLTSFICLHYFDWMPVHVTYVYDTTV